MAIVITDNPHSGGTGSFETRTRFALAPGIMAFDRQTELDIKQAQEEIKLLITQITTLPISGSFFFTVTPKEVATAGKLEAYFGCQPECSALLRELAEILQTYRRRFRHAISKTSFDLNIALVFR